MQGLRVARKASAAGACALVFGALFVPAASAQRYTFKFYGDDEGLKNLAVQAVLQDRAGFLWAGTQNGLYRYDGSHFTAYSLNDGLPGARIESLYESADGILWVGTDGGLARRVEDKFQKVDLRGREGLLARDLIGRQDISSDRSGRLYLATDRGLLVGVWQRDQLMFERAPSASGASPSEVTSVYTDSTGTVWFGCGVGFCRLDHGIASEVGVAAGLPPGPWEAILGDLDGNLWVRSESALYLRPSGSPRFVLQRCRLPPATHFPHWRSTQPGVCWFLPIRGSLAVPGRGGRL